MNGRFAQHVVDKHNCCLFFDLQLFFLCCWSSPMSIFPTRVDLKRVICDPECRLIRIRVVSCPVGAYPEVQALTSTMGIVRGDIY
jgi:hypothetical protein